VRNATQITENEVLIREKTIVLIMKVEKVLKQDGLKIRNAITRRYF
jgi:hypothetical protein